MTFPGKHQPNRNPTVVGILWRLLCNKEPSDHTYDTDAMALAWHQ